MAQAELFSQTNRRDFLKRLGKAMGGIVLTFVVGCGNDDDQGGDRGNGPLGTVPNGYRFHRVFTLGTNQHGLDQIGGLTPGVMINDNAKIIFYAKNSSDGMGVYELTMNLAEDPPTIVSSRAIVETGDVLVDGRRVDTFATGDTNTLGSFAIVLGTNIQDGEVATEENMSGVYLETNASGLQPLVRFRDPIPGGNGLYGGSFGDLALHDDNDMLLVSHFTRDGEVQGQEGLFHLPGGVVAHGSLILQTGDMIPQSSDIFRALGLVDLSDGGNYVLQAYGTLPNSNGVFVTQPSALIQGNVSDPVAMASLLAASSTLQGAQAASTSATVMGPRIGPNNVAAHVTHPTETSHALIYRDNRSQIVARTGLLSLSSTEVIGISAPVVGPNGLVYCQYYTDADPATGPGVELTVTDGLGHLQILLSQGDTIEGSMPIVNILHGFHSAQVDSAGRIVCMVEFGDGVEGGQTSTSLVLGIPV